MNLINSFNFHSQRLVALLLVFLMSSGTAVAVSSPAFASTPGTYSVTVKEKIDEEISLKSGVVVKACFNGATNQWECIDSAASDSEGLALVSGISLPDSTGYLYFSAGGPETPFSEAWAHAYIIDGAVSWSSDLILQPTTWEQKTVTAKFESSNTPVANAHIQISKAEDGWTRTLWASTNANGVATFNLDLNIWGRGGVNVYLEEVLGLHTSDSKTLNFSISPAAELVVAPLYTPGNFTVDLKEQIAGVDTAVQGLTVTACHAGSGNWDCSLTAQTNEEGIATFTGISLPNSTGYVSFTAGGPGTNYSKTWSGQYVENGVPQWRPYPMYMTSTTWIDTEVTVVRSGSGLPLRNVNVKLSTPADGYTLTEYVTTDAQGQATIELDSNSWGGERVVTAQIESWSGFSSDPTTVTKTVVDGVTTASVQLVTTSLSYALSGIITDSDGQPFASKEVCISYWNNQKSTRIDVVTSRTGYYSVDDITSAYVNFNPGSCDSYEYGTYDWQSGYNYPNTKPDTATHNFQFTKTGVRLTVTDTDGIPAAFVPVQLKDGSEYPQTRVTDQFGVAVFTGLSATTSYTAAYKRDLYHYDPLRFADKENSTSVSPVSANRLVNETLVLSRLPGALETPVTVSGRLVSINGNAISNGKVSVYVYQSSGNNWSNIQTSVTTDAQGRFSISNLPHGSVSLNISAKGFRQSYSYFETSSSEGNTYNRGDFQMRTEIRGNLSYSGVLRDSKGAPIPDMVLVMHRPGVGSSIQVETDPAGGFTFENLTSGWHGIYAQTWYEDYEWKYWNVNLSGTVLDAALTLTSREIFAANSTASISGNVSEYLDVSGPGSKVPVAGVCVYAYSWDGGMGGGSSSTDANGNWSISGLVDGKEYRYHIQDSCTYTPNAQVRLDYMNKYEYPTSDTTLVAKNNGGVPGEFLLKEISRSGTGSVSGRVKDVDDYTNLAGVSVAISRARGGIVIDPVVTDSRGEYSFQNLPEGDYYLQIGDYEQKTYYASWMSVEVGTGANRVNAFLTKVSSSTLEGSVSGRVFDEFGKPHGSGAVNVWGADDNAYYGWTYTDNSGDFTIKGLPVGVNLMMSILPQWQELAEFFQEITITTGNSFVVSPVNLKTAATISGAVSGLPSGENAPTAILYAELIDKENERILQTTYVDPSSGQYVFNRVPEGTFVIRFTQNPFNSGWHGREGDGGYFQAGSEAEVYSVKPVYWNRTQFGTTDFNSAREIEINAGDTRRSINVEVSTGSKLVGTLSVATPDGSSLLTGTREVLVTAYQKRSNGKWLPVASSYISGATKSTFMIAGLAEGSYKLEFFDFRKGNNSLATSYNGGASSLEEAPEIVVGAGQRVVASHTMNIAPPEKSAEAFDLDDLGADRLAELKDEIVLDAEAAPGSEVEIFVGNEFAGEFVSTFANSTPVVLGDWQQVNSRGYIKVKIPTTLPSGSHRIAVQDSRSVVFGWAPITIKGTAAVVTQPAAQPVAESAATKAKPKSSKAVVEAETEETEKKPATTEEAVAVAAATDSSGDWLLPLAGGFLLIAAVGSAWAFRSRRHTAVRR